MKFEEEQKRIDLMEYWRVIVKRKHVFFSFAGTLLILVGIYSFAVSPKYRPVATLLIEEDTSKMLSIEDEFGTMGYRSQMRDTIFLNTQLMLLKSKSLAKRVAQKMDLLSRPEFGAGAESKESLLKKTKDFVTLKWLRPKKDPEDGDGISRDPYFDIVKKMQRGMNVTPIRDTKVVRISYTSPYPVLATEIVNAYAEEYIVFYIDKKYQVTQKASDFLGERIVNLREEISVKQRELQEYGQEKEIVYLTEAETESASYDTFADLTSALTQAQIARYRAQAAYQELRNVDVDSIPQSVTDPVVQNIRNEYTSAKSEYDRMSQIYKEDYPEMVQLRAKMESLQEELKKVVFAAESEYKAVLRQENLLRQSVDNQRREVARLNSDVIYYNALRTEVENMQKLLNSLEEMKNEARVSAQLRGFKPKSISIIDAAEIPEGPVSPKKKLNLLLALLIGTIGGVGFCFIFDYLDNTIKGPEEVEKISGISSLGVIPYLPQAGEKRERQGKLSFFGKTHQDKKRSHASTHALPEVNEIELVNHLYPNSSLSEDYRTVRTSILLSRVDYPPKMIAFSSCLPMEGKTATVANMAVAFAQLNKKVTILDADMRRPRLHKVFNVQNSKGLTGYLSGECTFKEAVLKTSVENVKLMPSGPTPPNPAELLDSEMMKILMNEIKRDADYVLIDTPPVLAVVDSLVISTLVDCVVLVVQPEKTTRKPFLGAVEQLRQSQSNIIGIVLNKSDIHTGQYYNKYSYYRQYYGQTGA